MKIIDLDTVNNYIKFINEYKHIEGLSEISANINRLKNALNENNIYLCDKLCKTIVETTDFENIPIQYVNSNSLSHTMKVLYNCRYIIERLSLLAMNKIAKHELGKELENINTDISFVYKTLLSAIEHKIKNKKY